MVSDASKKREAQKKAAAAAKRAGKSGASAKQVKEAAAAAFASATSTGADNGKADSLANGIGELQISDRTCTGVLCSHPLSRDIRVSLIQDLFSLSSRIILVIIASCFPYK